jgi:hypothetical protein
LTPSIDGKNVTLAITPKSQIPAGVEVPVLLKGANGESVERYVDLGGEEVTLTAPFEVKTVELDPEGKTPARLKRGQSKGVKRELTEPGGGVAR